MPNQFLSDEFGDIEDYFVTDYWLIDQYIGDQLWVWGQGSLGRIGTNVGSFSKFLTPTTTFAGGTNWKQVSGASGNMAAIKTDGSLWVWGWNGGPGQIGDNTIIDRSTPVTTFAGGNDWKQVSSGGYHTAAIKTDGSLWTWGRNNQGQLGTNNTTSRSTPVTTFAGGTNWKQVDCGRDHTAAIKTDGTLWTLGRNHRGQLGDNTTTNRNIPVTTFAGGNNWKQVSAFEHTTAIKTDGSLWTWGFNGNGPLGINNAITRSTPVTTFAGGNNWKQVNASVFHTSAIQTIDYI